MIARPLALLLAAPAAFLACCRKTSRPRGPVTWVTQTYAVGDHMRYRVEDIASAIDGVLREALDRLAALFAQEDRRSD